MPNQRKLVVLSQNTDPEVPFIAEVFDVEKSESIQRVGIKLPTDAVQPVPLIRSLVLRVASDAKWILWGDYLTNLDTGISTPLQQLIKPAGNSSPTTDAVLGAAFSPSRPVLGIVARHGPETSTTSSFAVYFVSLNNLSAVVTTAGHRAKINDFVFCPKGQVFFSACGDGLIRLWDVRTGQQRLALDGHSSGVNCLAINELGTILASGDDNGTIRLWDAWRPRGVPAKGLSNGSERLLAPPYSSNPAAPPPNDQSADP
jgi:WD40 repeat protein